MKKNLFKFILSIIFMVGGVKYVSADVVAPQFNESNDAAIILQYDDSIDETVNHNFYKKISESVLENVKTSKENRLYNKYIVKADFYLEENGNISFEPFTKNFNICRFIINFNIHRRCCFIFISSYF